ncbi:FtsX-like permease family protein [Acidobacteria bacterium ACD]|nr:MAG: ABC transporter permease [Acidobacteriota bacterium]MCE7958712.1 ABC transporter permease [Acidobacteria bacterium ACB2]MDL1951617.1 FtsX-like permease family protein [Acidobacteria bacterium ACD]
MLLHTLRSTVRVLLRRKFFTAVSLFGVALTLVVLVVAAALLDHTFGPHPPEVSSGRTLGVFRATLKGTSWTRNGGAGGRLLETCARELPGAEITSFYSAQDQEVTYRDGERVPLWVKRTDGAFWRALHFRFLEGGPFTDADDAAANAVAVVNDATRRKLFGDVRAVGKELRLDGRTFTVVGVVADVPFLRAVPFADVWLPLRTARSDAESRAWVGERRAIIVARSRADLPGIREEYRRRVAAVDLSAEPQFDRLESEAETLLELGARAVSGSSPHRVGLAVAFSLALAVGFMALPALNLVNLALSRILERSSEVGVRKAFGATRWRLVLQFVTENVVLSLAGGALGVVLSAGVLSAVNRSGLVPYAQLTLNVRVLLWGFLATCAFGVLSGALPALRMSRLHPVEALQGGPR